MVVTVFMRVILLLAVLMVTACGNKGALSLPQEALPSDNGATTTDY